MNLSPQWVDRLNAADMSAVHWSSVGRMDAADIEIMAYAAKHDYVVLTHDLDFSAILAATQGTKPSVVQIRSDNLSPAIIGEPLIAACNRCRRSWRPAHCLRLIRVAPDSTCYHCALASHETFGIDSSLNRYHAIA